MMKLMTYRTSRLGLSVILFVFALGATWLILEADRASTKIFFNLNQMWSGVYPDREGKQARELRIVDLGLPLQNKTPTIKQACAQVLDSLKAHRARVIAVDIFFDPALDTTGRGALLKSTKQCSAAVFTFKFTTQQDKDSVILTRHNIPYSSNENESAENYTARKGHEFYGVSAPLMGVAEAASHMGFLDLFEEQDGACRFYPLLRRLSADNKLFAALAAKAFLLWQNAETERDSLKNILATFEWMGVGLRTDGTIKLKRISPKSTRLQDIQANENRFAGYDFKDKLVLLVNSPTEEEEVCNLSRAGWQIHAAALSQLLEPAQGFYVETWLLLFAGYMAGVLARLWPPANARQWRFRGKEIALGVLLVLWLLPFVLRQPSMFSDAPLWSSVILGLALTLFELMERRLARLPKVMWRDLQLVYEDETNGALRVSVVEAPVQIGKRASFVLPWEKAKAWENYKLAPYLTEAAAMREQGEALYDFLMAGEIGALFTASLEQVIHENQNRKARVMLRLKVRNQSQKFSALPFELLRTTAKNYGYLARHDCVALVRDLTADPERKPEWQTPLRLLLLTASPRAYGYCPLDLEAEKKKIMNSTRLLRRKGWLYLDTLDHVTPTRLEQLATVKYDLIHYVGHGTINAETQSNCLVWEKEDGTATIVDAGYVGQVLHKFSPQLVFLNACKTGEGEEAGVFLNIARELERTTGATVIAHQYQVSDFGGVVFSEAFYQAFAETLSPEFALSRARQALAGTSEALASDWVSLVHFVQ